MPVRAPDVSVPEPVVGDVARIASQPVAKRDRIADGPANTRVKILQLPAGYLARLVNTNEMQFSALVTQVVADTREVAERRYLSAQRGNSSTCQRGY